MGNILYYIGKRAKPDGLKVGIGQRLRVWRRGEEGGTRQQLGIFSSANERRPSSSHCRGPRGTILSKLGGGGRAHQTNVGAEIDLKKKEGVMGGSWAEPEECFISKNAPRGGEKRKTKTGIRGGGI